MQLEVGLEDLGPLQKKLSITIAVEEVDDRFASAYRKLRKETQLSGFRKGKVKRKQLERRFGKQVTTEITADLVSESLRETLTTHELQPVGKPDLDMGKAEEGQPFVYTATIWLRPEPTAADYTGIPLSRKTPMLTNAELDGHVDSMRMQSGVMETVEEDRPVADGDVVDLTLTFQDPSYGDLIREHQLMRMPDDPHHAFLCDLVRDLNRGDTVTETVLIPDDYLQRDWAGRTCKVAVLVHAIQSVTPPPLDDDFAKRMGHDNVDELREELRNELLEMMIKRNRESEVRQLVSAVIERNPFDLPPPMIAERARGIVASVAAQLTDSMSNTTPPTLDDLDDEKRQDVLNEAEYTLRRELLLDAIAEQEALSIDDADRDTGLENLATQTGQPVEVLRELLPASSMAQIEGNLLQDKTVAWLLEHSEAVEDA